MKTQPRGARGARRSRIEDRAIAREAILDLQAPSRSSSLRDCFAGEIERSVASIGAMTCKLTDPAPIEACRSGVIPHPKGAHARHGIVRCCCYPALALPSVYLRAFVNEEAIGLRHHDWSKSYVYWRYSYRRHLRKRR